MKPSEASAFLGAKTVYHDNFTSVLDSVPAHLKHCVIALRNHKTSVSFAPQYREALSKAKTEYNAGRAEMCQGRIGDYIIQYAIPLKTPQLKRIWF